MATAVFKIYDESGNLILDLSDNVAGNVVQFSTGKSNGSRTISTSSGEYVEFAFPRPYGIITPGSQSPFPNITVLGNKIQWSFDSSGASVNFPTDIIGFIY